MNIRSLGYRTDLIFPRFDGEIIDRGEYIVVRTPTCPNFYWGNFILFDAPPRAGCAERWISIFADEIGSRAAHPGTGAEIGGQPGTNHIAIGWDGVDGDAGEIDQFVERGFEVNEAVSLAASFLQAPPHFNDDVVIRTIANDRAWQQATDLQIHCRDEKHGLEGYTTYMTRQMDRYRKMTEAGLGNWYGAFLDGKLVAGLGVFTDGNLARYQHVSTHPDFRRRGICGTLVFEAGRHMLETTDADAFVMVADEIYHAGRIYESGGFEIVEKTRGITWWAE